jgi:transposase
VKLPPYSPDINIIELVWAELKRFLRKKLLRNEQEIADRVALFFETQLTIDKCRNYISRVNQVNYLKRLDKNNLVIFKNFLLFKVLQKIIEKNGDWTDY